MEGPLSKWTNVMKGWQYRWFVLDYNAGLLSYYTVSLSCSAAIYERGFIALWPVLRSFNAGKGSEHLQACQELGISAGWGGAWFE